MKPFLSWRKLGRLVVPGVGIAAVAAAAYALIEEVQTSRWQARQISKVAGELGFEVQPGATDQVRYPGEGPYDLRLGYTQLPMFIDRLQRQGYAVQSQARMSPRMVSLADHGVFPTYHEKNQGGLDLVDCRGESMFAARYPQRVYPGFDAVPPLLVQALLFIENRELLDANTPQRNPAVEWDRFGKAAVSMGMRLVGDSGRSPGGSTLATQIEKYRHSPEGRTEGVKDKLRQMASASLRAYLDGPDTLERRRQIVTDYINTVPLAAKAGFGEVNGLGDGMWAWYGRDFEEVNQLLTDSGELPRPDLQAQQALAFKQALSLMISQRRPSHYLLDADTNLDELTNSYLRLLTDAGLISPALRDAALAIKLELSPQPVARAPQQSFVDRKAATAVRTRLSAMLDVPRAYDLDRIDVRASATLDTPVQRTATELLRGLRTPEGARAAGLYGHHLLKEGDDPSKLVFSFTLFERGEGVNRLRVQTDNWDQPFDINEGARLDLGSTSKLRTLVTYLEMVAELHERWGKLDPIELAALQPHERDHIGRWAREYLMRTGERALQPMLDAAMLRKYSAGPGEGFFTGGGLHYFANFEPNDNGRIMTVAEAMRHSVNLPFIRLMRDVVWHVMYNSPTTDPALFTDPDSPQRREYLQRFADKEGQAYLLRFWRKYQGKDWAQARETLLQGVRETPPKLTAVLRTIEPQASMQDLSDFLVQRLEGEMPDYTDRELRKLYDTYDPARMSLHDRGYVASVHPLELWLVGWLRMHPEGTFTQAVEASAKERQEVYAWLFKTRYRGAQDVRIRNLLEIEAFLDIHRRWKRLGYPFESLTPSYASALGASGDRPAALAEFMGILANGGVRQGAARIEELHFAAGTPYETRLALRGNALERVLPEEVAFTARRAAFDVVANGTARRLNGVLKLADGSVVPIGGKTGTGDHRKESFGRYGQMLSSRVISRSATFMFVIGDRYFGTMMAYVQEPDAAKYKFTSALPSQLMKSLAPALVPLLEKGSCEVPRREPETAPAEVLQNVQAPRAIQIRAEAPAQQAAR
ncbi:transglycosylase domain-containing protein [Azohydromonas aeria]|uniref:transglycosylase domain-containing protein n=1 Tax=Azohydromonas aeria TaxID=2590212 RepID=UPI0018DF5352|nr:transglycosylase domain-containing protein [Azohydromonas aeria]